MSHPIARELEIRPLEEARGAHFEASFGSEENTNTSTGHILSISILWPEKSCGAREVPEPVKLSIDKGKHSMYKVQQADRLEILGFISQFILSFLLYLP